MNEISKAASVLGRKGGKAGSGKAKKRSPEHYSRLSKLGVEARKFKGNSHDRRKKGRKAKREGSL